MVKKVYDMNVPLNLHCNGDASIDAFLKAYEFARAGDFSKPWDVTTIHSQFMRKDQIPKFVKYGVRPSFYTLHTYYFYEAHLSNRGMEEAQYISPMRDALDAGMKPTNHTDFVVAPLDQMFMLWSAVNRISRAGAEVGTSQKVTPYEGLQAMTIYVADQYDEADSKGSLKINKRADMVILDKNPLKVNVMDIKDIKIIETIKDGKTIYNKTRSASRYQRFGKSGSSVLRRKFCSCRKFLFSASNLVVKIATFAKPESLCGSLKTKV